MNGSRLKLSLVVGGLVASAIVLVAWTQVWFDVLLTSGQSVAVRGETAAGALTALAIAGLALGAALAIAGPVFRVILGVLEASIGGLIVWSAVTGIAQPVSASAAAVTAATGVDGAESVAALVSTLSATPWPGIVLAAGILITLVGLAVVGTSRLWPATSRKYQAVRLESAEGERSSIGDWDSLSDGHDPT